MNSTQLKELIIRPVLNHLELYSPEAENLILGTACAESHCGQYLNQLNNGPARGIYQMELATAKDIFDNYLRYKRSLDEKVMDYYIPDLTMSENLQGNLFFATAMCRIHYLRVKAPIPKTLEGQALYWKTYYNSTYGAGTVEGYIEKYKKYGKS